MTSTQTILIVVSYSMQPDISIEHGKVFSGQNSMLSITVSSMSLFSTF